MVEKEETKESKTASRSAPATKSTPATKSAPKAASVLDKPFCSVHGVRGCTKHEKKG